MSKLILTAGEHSVTIRTFREDSQEANTNGFMDALEFLEASGGLSENELFDAHKVILRAIKAEKEVSSEKLVVALSEAVPSLSVENQS